MREQDVQCSADINHLASVLALSVDSYMTDGFIDIYQRVGVAGLAAAADAKITSGESYTHTHDQSGCANFNNM